MSDLRYFRARNGLLLSTADEHSIQAYIRDGWTEFRATPLDAIVIDPADLPEVTPDGDEITVGQVSVWGREDPADVERVARDFLAAARYLREHQPLDPQVQALVDDLDTIDGDTTADLAAALIARGWTKGGRRYARGETGRIEQVEEGPR